MEFNDGSTPTQRVSSIDVRINEQQQSDTSHEIDVEQFNQSTTGSENSGFDENIEHTDKSEKNRPSSRKSKHFVHQTRALSANHRKLASLPVNTSVVSLPTVSTPTDANHHPALPRVSTDGYIPHNCVLGNNFKTYAGKDNTASSRRRRRGSHSSVSQLSTSLQSDHSGDTYSAKTATISDIMQGSTSYQVHSRIAGWKLTSPARRTELISMLENDYRSQMEDKSSFPKNPVVLRGREAAAWEATVRCHI